MKLRICDGVVERVVPASSEVVDQAFVPGAPWGAGTEVSLAVGQRSLVAVALGAREPGGDGDSEEFLLTSADGDAATVCGPVERREALRRFQHFFQAAGGAEPEPDKGLSL